MIAKKKIKKTPKNPKKPKKNQKNPIKPKKTQKNPLGRVLLKKPGFFPTLCIYDIISMKMNV